MTIMTKVKRRFINDDRLSHQKLDVHVCLRHSMTFFNYLHKVKVIILKSKVFYLFTILEYRVDFIHKAYPGQAI